MVLGNGKSLLDAHLLDIPSFGCNYIGKIYQPTYFVCIDSIALVHDDLIYPTAKNAEIAFLRDFNSQDPKPHPLYDLPNVSLVTRKSYVFKGESTATGGTTTYLMLKIAYYMGFTRVYLYGVDHTTEHFSTDWISGVKPDLDGRIKHYKLAMEMYRKDGREIINRSAPSVLNTIFSVS